MSASHVGWERGYQTLLRDAVSPFPCFRSAFLPALPFLLPDKNEGSRVIISLRSVGRWGKLPLLQVLSGQSPCAKHSSIVSAAASPHRPQNIVHRPQMMTESCRPDGRTGEQAKTIYRSRRERNRRLQLPSLSRSSSCM